MRQSPERSAEQRRQNILDRIRAAGARDAQAHARDVTAAARDQLAALDDRELAGREATGDPDAGLEARTRASADREQAARDRESAARDRLQAQADRESLLAQIAIAETDELTGARTRAAGLADLEIEIERTRRTQGRLVVGYIDVVGLKEVNDTRGHIAGDELLSGVVRALRVHTRPYDLVIRLGDDEFLCAMSGVTPAAARTRLRSVRRELAAAPDPCDIKVGFAALSSGDTVDVLVRRADTELPTALPRAAMSRQR
ncbi:MAG: GGDEF domain-containing protein, partial [Solirubrobacteraceae bacterium]